MIDEYTRLLESSAGHADDRVASEAVSKLVAHLKSTGRVKMLPAILRQLRTIAARRRALAPVVEVAHEKEAARALRDAAAAGIVAKHVHINTALIHGWRARSGSQLVDRSAKRALIDIYQKVTA